MELVPEGPTMRRRPIVVCLHGGPGFDHSTLKPFLGPLEDVAQLIFLDHRGQGRSDESTPSRWNLDTWIDDVAAFCDVLGVERPIILGQSFGEMVGLGVAIRYPELPSRLVVSSSLARFRPDRRWRSSRSWAVWRLGTWRRGSFATPIRRASTHSWSPAFRSIAERRAIRMCGHA
jgi:pimeloyl-ACP methyl ester carboxylesterase